MNYDRNYKSNEGRKVVLVGLSLTALGILGYIGWSKFKEYRERKREESNPENLPASVPKIVSPIRTGFPLKQGSSGAEVKAIQQMLIQKYGVSILPKYGADGSFGSELSAALRSKGLPEIIDENTFNMLINPRTINAPVIAKGLFQAILTRNFAQIIPLLQQLKSTSDYSTVSENFKQFRLGVVRQTLVNALLNTFSGDQKEKIKTEFLRMGLKFDGSKWSLSGISFPPRVITTIPTLVWNDNETAIKVPANYLLGYQVAERNGLTVFKSIKDGEFLVKTESIKYI